MTKVEWDAATDPGLMLAFVRDTLGQRKRRLFGCACCRRVWNQLSDARSRVAVIVAERYAEGEVTEAELEVAANDADSVWISEDTDANGELVYPFSAAAYNVAIDHGWWGGAPAFQPPDVIIRAASTDVVAEGVAQCDLLRDIFNPFRMAAPDATWLTDTVIGLARSINALGDFTHLPILADALEDAGCDDAEILDHCRGVRPHVRGCWVIDVLLGTA